MTEFTDEQYKSALDRAEKAEKRASQAEADLSAKESFSDKDSLFFVKNDNTTYSNKNLNMTAKYLAQNCHSFCVELKKLNNNEMMTLNKFHSLIKKHVVSKFLEKKK